MAKTLGPIGAAVGASATSRIASDNVQPVQPAVDAALEAADSIYEGYDTNMNYINPELTGAEPGKATTMPYRIQQIDGNDGPKGKTLPALNPDIKLPEDFNPDKEPIAIEEPVAIKEPIPMHPHHRPHMPHAPNVRPPRPTPSVGIDGPTGGIKIPQDLPNEIEIPESPINENIPPVDIEPVDPHTMPNKPDFLRPDVDKPIEETILPDKPDFLRPDVDKPIEETILPNRPNFPDRPGLEPVQNEPQGFIDRIKDIIEKDDNDKIPVDKDEIARKRAEKANDLVQGIKSAIGLDGPQAGE